jgi:hypothetical protein
MKKIGFTKQAAHKNKCKNNNNPLLNSSTPQLLNSSTPQLLNPSTPQLLNPLFACSLCRSKCV